VTQPLRPYQARAIDALRDGLRAGHRRLLLVAPTGAGKTTIASHVIASAVARGRKVQFWAHRTELISQCSHRLDDHEIPHGILQGSRSRAAHEPVQVVSVPTLVRRPERAQGVDLVIVDEAHRSVSASYVRCLEAVGPRATVIGLTATPYRSDGAPLGDLYEDLVVVAQPEELVDAGFLMRPTMYAPDRPQLDGVRSRGGDYVAEQLAERMIRLGGNVVRCWQRLAGDERTVVFACNVRHSEDVVARFCEAGIRAEHVDGETPAAQRDAILARLRSGETQVVSNVGILTEGWDLPTLGAVVLARPTKSRGLYLQMVGRVLRTAEGKDRAIVLDHGGNVERFGSPTDPTAYSLAEDEAACARSARPDGPTVRVCGRCFAVFAAPERTCGACGWTMPEAPIPVEEEDVEMVEVRAPTGDQAIGELMALLRQAERRGYKDGWVAHRYKGRYGSFPSRWLIDAARRAL
jgi:DNA repair protein RadD